MPRMRCTNSRLAVGRLPGVTGARSKQESSVTLGLSFRRRERGWPMPPAAPSTATLKPRCCWVAMVARCRKQDAKIQARTCARQCWRPTPPRPPPPRATSPGHAVHALVAVEPLLAARRRRARTRAGMLCHVGLCSMGNPPPHPVGEATAESRQEAQQVGRSARACHAPEPPGACTHGQVGEKGLGVTQHGAEDTCSLGTPSEIFCKNLFPCGYVILTNTCNEYV